MWLPVCTPTRPCLPCNCSTDWLRSTGTWEKLRAFREKERILSSWNKTWTEGLAWALGGTSLWEEGQSQKREDEGSQEPRAVSQQSAGV